MSAAQPRISDAAVRKATGKSWDEWFAVLDSAGADALPHKQIARLLFDKGYIASHWWCQTVTVAYEYARGKRVLGRDRERRIRNRCAEVLAAHAGTSLGPTHATGRPRAMARYRAVPALAEARCIQNSGGHTR